MKKGFTMMELLIAIAIAGVLTAVVLASLSSFRSNQSVKTETEAIVSILKEAQSKSLASEDSSQYGVHLDTPPSTRYVLFKGTTFSEGNPNNEVYNMPSGVEIKLLGLTGGAQDIVFERLTGGTSQDGSFEIGPTGGVATKRISLTTIGIIDASDL